MSSAPPAVIPPDEEGLFSALCIAPGTYSRNQYFELFRLPHVRRAKRRALLVRSLARQLTRLSRDGVAHEAIYSATEEGFMLALDVPEKNLRRKTMLTPLERDALEYLLARAGLAPNKAPSALISHALARLARI